MTTQQPVSLIRRTVGENVWLARAEAADVNETLARPPVHDLWPDVLETEEAVGRAMLEELEAAARSK